jgi:hypothetical protein
MFEDKPAKRLYAIDFRGIASSEIDSVIRQAVNQCTGPTVIKIFHSKSQAIVVNKSLCRLGHSGKVTTWVQGPRWSLLTLTAMRLIDACPDIKNDPDLCARKNSVTVILTQ